MSVGGYKADVPASEVWRHLSADMDALLVDVRSQAEWTFVGVPDLSPVGKETLLLEWQRYPGMVRNTDFVSQLRGALGGRGAGPDTALYFLCRSGGRSAAAAAAMAAAGYHNCFNVADGFEGRLDGTRHRGGTEGWKAAGLPWVQS
jgi:rhodanese-related sulfurtransferase